MDDSAHVHGAFASADLCMSDTSSTTMESMMAVRPAALVASFSVAWMYAWASYTTPDL